MSHRNTGRPLLSVPRSEATLKLQNRIDEILKIKMLCQTADTQDDFDKAYLLVQKWQNYNTRLYDYLFGGSLEYSTISFLSDEFGNWYFPDTSTAKRLFLVNIDKGIAQLEATVETLELIPEDTERGMISSTTDLSSKVFIVHGHDEEAREAVARFVEKLGLTAIILQERPNQGRTIIEKFEAESLNVGFAIVLMTPDDIGAPKEEPTETQYRARQNVIFELGYFAGSLGRAKVCILHKGFVELPSDFYGVVYVEMDANGGWKMQLAREMKAAKLDVDMNRVI